MKKVIFSFLGLAPFAVFAQAVQFTSACGPQNFCFNQNACGPGAIQFTAAATGGCGGLAISWDLDIGNNGSIDQEGDGPTISKAVATAGPHRVVFLAKDNCGSAAMCTVLFIGKDCQPPNILLSGGLSQSLEQPNCTATINPKLFVTSASDNCTAANQLEYSIRRKGAGTGWPGAPTLTVGACEIGTVLVEIWARDLAGNAGQYNSYALIQPGAGGCECPRDTIVFAGKMTTEEGVAAFPSNFSPAIGGGTGGYPAVLTPVVFDSTTGDYAFKAIARVSPTPYTVRIEPKKLTGPTNGVSTFDLVSISKHILGASPLQTVYKMAAADVNFDGSPSTADIVELRKVILGIFFDFQINTSWRFVEAVADPTDLSQVANLKSSKLLPFTVLQGQNVPDFLNLDFKAIKIGDLNGSADPKL